MMTRIRYKLNDQGLFVTTKEVLVGDTLVNVVLDPRNNSFSFVEVGGLANVVMQGTASNMVDLKRLVKFKLRESGVQFSDEVRRGKAKSHLTLVPETNDDPHLALPSEEVRDVFDELTSDDSPEETDDSPTEGVV